MSDNTAAGDSRDEQTLHAPLGPISLADTADAAPRRSTKIEIPDTLGPYEIIDLIGRGGMGLVLKGRDGALNREVAIKVLHPDCREDAEVRKRFIREAQISGQLEHPGIAPVHFLGWGEGRVEFFSMKLVAGETFDKLIDRWHKKDAATRATFPLPRLLNVFERVCETVSFAHSRMIIHRDIKPSNIMVGKHGEVWLLDWGLAKVFGEPDDVTGVRREYKDTGSDITLAGSVMGTPEYMAPEQASGETLDEGADIFGLGAVFYEILTGNPPHSGKTIHEVVSRAAQARVTPVQRTKAGRSVPRALAAIAEKCMRPRRADRYASVDDLLKDLRAYASGDAVKAMPDSVMERLRRFSRRHRRGVVIGGAMAAVIMLTVTISAVIISQKERDAREADSRSQQERAKRLEAELEQQRTLASASERARRRLAAFEPFSQATDLLMRGQLPDRAVELLKQANAMDPQFPEAQFALGEALRSSGQPLLAAAAYLKADELSRQIAGRPNLHAIVSAGFAFDGAGSYVEAEDAFALAEKQGASDPLALVGKTFRLGHHSKFREARQVAEQALNMAPHLWETHFAMGYVTLQSIEDGLIPPDQNAGAIMMLKKALELSPRQAEVCVWLAIALSRTRDRTMMAEAVGYMDRAIMLEPRNGNRYISRANYRLSGGNTKGAEADVAEATRLGVSPALLLLHRARVAALNGNDEEGFKLMGELVQKTRQWPAHVANWANVGFKLGKFSEIKPVIEQLSLSNPDLVYLYVLRGALKAKEGNYAAAVEIAQEGLKAAPYHRNLRQFHLLWLAGAGDYQQALKECDKVLEIFPGDLNVEVSRMEFLVKLGRGKEAFENLDRLEKSRPEFAEKWTQIRAKLKAAADKK